ncbi:MAG: LPS-assembly protein LptD [Verrucomicrobia subdivision 3 bacterium]|nr:LPS-assembly protein LptD [Limisphaerales bacterium]MCS1417815.1 LPS-assembly protein LptD [Limisphaerales bacterium]
MRFVWWLSVACLIIANDLPCISAQENAEWEIESLSGEGGFSYHPEVGIAIAINGVIVKYKDLEHGEAVLSADRITLDQISGQVTAEGSVTLQRDGQAWSSEQLEYNFLTRAMDAVDYRTGKSPFFAAGTSVIGSSDASSYTATDAYLTTDDVKNPNHRIRAKRIKIVPGRYFSAWNATVYAGKVPVMYLPYFKASLDRKGNRWSITPGYRSRYGGFLHTTYHYQVFTNLTAKLNFDYRTRRGLGGGPDFQYDLGPYGAGETKTYYLHDDIPGINPAGNRTSAERFRFRLSHRVNIRTNITAKAVFNKLSDSQINRDFFESEHRRNTQPRSFLEIEQLGQNFSLSLLAQPRINDFYERIERLPEVKLSAFRQQIGRFPVYYESESTAGYLGHQFINNVSNDFHATRLDTWHQLIVPHTFFGWLNIGPRVGGRYTYYTATDGQGTTMAEGRRGVFNTGVKANFRASRSYPTVTNRFWALQGLRHIVQPSVNYVFVPEPAVLPPALPQFDTEIPSLRQLPIQFPSYNSIDSVDAQNVVRLGLRNKLQTKRGPNDAIQPFADWNIFTDWRLDPQTTQADFSDINTELDLYPRDWMSFHSFVRYSLDHSHFRLANHRVTLLPDDIWSVTLGHLYLRDEFNHWGAGNNVFYSSLYYRFNENWGARLNHQFEARDGTLEEQAYTLYRDFRSWTGALSFRIRDERTAPPDYTVALILSLKAFPRFGVGEDALQNSLLSGR